MTKAITFPNATRVTVVGDDSVIAYERYGQWRGGVEIHIQDDGRTVKLFPMTRGEDEV